MEANEARSETKAESLEELVKAYSEEMLAAAARDDNAALVLIAMRLCADLVSGLALSATEPERRADEVADLIRHAIQARVLSKMAEKSKSLCR
ncbi:MAG: hypothetical protein K8I29_19640 [Alphaproteobacteria bacterium]|uniref:Uncharacterized protein n=1 Tax=Candidatus Nitrobium versatile TaxID=2884831 RepID=A0A953M3R3_9BACT|nr:hypothetical protein [Candidatus Nitrobium versatile]